MAAIAQRLNRELSAAIVAPAVVERLASFGMLLQPSASPDEFRRLIAADALWMAEAALGLKLETQQARCCTDRAMNQGDRCRRLSGDQKR